MSDRWLLPVLATLRVPPGMFLGDERVKSLSLYLAAYSQGRMDASGTGMDPADEALLRSFSAWLVDCGLLEKQDSAGWSEQVAQLDPSPSSVKTFFTLFEEFLRGTGRSLSDVERWTPRGLWD